MYRKSKSSIHRILGTLDENKILDYKVYYLLSISLKIVTKTF